MTDPITPDDLARLKQFWAEEDIRNGGVSDVTRCIREIERLQGDNEYLVDVIRDAIQSLEFEEPPSLVKEGLQAAIPQS